MNVGEGLLEISSRPTMAPRSVLHNEVKVLPEKDIIDAVKKAVESSKDRKFKETVELAINLKDVDLSNPKNRIDDEVLLTKGRGKQVKIGVFGSGEFALKAKKSADIVINPEELEELSNNKQKAKKMVNAHQFFIAEAPLMPVIGKRLGVILGPRGKMPKPLPPQADPTPIINNLKNTVKLRTKERKTMHTPIGTKDMPVDDLAENLEIVLKRVENKLDRGRMNIASVYVKTTMGPSIRII